MNVTLNGPEQFSADTQSDGKATFNNIIGGNMQIIAQASGTQDAYQAITLTVNEPTSLQIKIDKYVASRVDVDTGKLTYRDADNFGGYNLVCYCRDLSTKKS